MKIITLILVLLSTSCDWEPENGEKEAVIKKCIPLCQKLDRKSYDVKAVTNGFGKIWNYNCLCYPTEGLVKPIIIIINKEDVKY